MSAMEPTKAELKKTRKLIEAYGADTARWPIAAAERYGALTGHRELSDAMAQAAVLDSALVLALGGAEALSLAGADIEPLRNAILADFDRLRPRRHSRLRAAFNQIGSVIGPLSNPAVFKRPLIPAGALVGLTALGFFAGIMSGDFGIEYSVDDEAFAYVEAVFGETLILEEEAGSWAEG